MYALNCFNRRFGIVFEEYGSAHSYRSVDHKGSLNPEEKKAMGHEGSLLPHEGEQLSQEVEQLDSRSYQIVY